VIRHIKVLKMSPLEEDYLQKATVKCNKLT